MRIILADHRGFCYGVKRAVEMATNCIGNGSNTYTYGPIIHNPQLVARLAAQGVTVANSLEQISSGTVVIRSHGVGPDVYKQATARNLTIVDATCPHVKKAQEAACQLAAEGYQIVVVGEADHPEVKSIIEWAGANTIAVENIQEALALSYMERMGVVVQTTFSAKLFEDIIEILKTKCQELKISRTICSATDLRQSSAVNLAKQVDVMLVVGGKNSGNTTRLAEVCRQADARTYHVETADELSIAWFEGVKIVGITAGASTPDWLIEEVYNKMQEFDQILNKDIKRLEPGTIVKAKVVDVRKDEVFVDIGYKAEGVIALTELAVPTPEKASDVVQEGQIIDILVLESEETDGIKLSKVKADKIIAWDTLESVFKTGQPVEAKIVGVVKGGLSAVALGVRAFVPASQIELKYVEDLSVFVGESYNFKIIEFDQLKQKVVLSRKVLLEEERRRQEELIFSNLAVGQVLTGKVSRLTDFGAFVDIGGIDGLIHISDLSWQRVKSPAEVVHVGDRVEVAVLKVDPKAKRISLSLKQAQRDPWLDAVTAYSEGMIVEGTIVKISKFGAFVELQKGVEGLIHLSELADRRVANAAEVVELGQQVKVQILKIDVENKRISLSLARAQEAVERAEYSKYLVNQNNAGVTIGDKLGHLFKRED